ncbi:uncharacterized protein [Lolium perenne]|uniref:uncharacterized protein n=1 Tax=Lolium perenne TaxID=4522 RepID=UPI003A9A2595
MASVRHFTAASTDHSPILFSWEERTRPHRRCTEEKLFGYEIMWETHEIFGATLEHIWQQRGKATTLVELQEKINAVTGSLQNWSSTTFGSVRKESRELREELGRLRNDSTRVGLTHTEIKIVDRLVDIDHREVVMWRQRSRIHWLAEGDKNTRFFHLRTSQRKRRNKISSLRRSDGETTDYPLEMANITNDFYRDLYRSEGTKDMEVVLDTVPRRVTCEMNEGLISTITTGEVKEALFQMFPTKAPGPD